MGIDNSRWTGTKATVTNVTVGVAAVQLLAASSTRLKCIIWNETGTLYVKLGTGASDTSYTVRLTANTMFQLDEYHGVVTAIKASGNSSVLVTDIS